MRLTRISTFILLLSLTIIGQTNRGGISGTVTDPSGSAVPGVKVTVTNAGTNQSVTLTTSDSGAFSASSLEPVIYTIVVEAPNFKTAIVENIKVDTASVQTVNVILEAGNISEKVTVEAETPLINTESGTTGQTITERQLQEIPLNNRSVLDLAVTVPNVSGDAGSEDAEVTSSQPVPGFNLNVNGGRSGSTNLMADGVNNTGVGISRAVVSFTPETVQEFTVQTSAYSAEFGSTGGGVINITTKSGTNLFRGTALVYHRNPATNAQPYRIGTTPRTPNNLRYTQASLSVGGPIFLPRFGEGTPYLYDGRDRSFFFFAYEPRWRQDFITVSTLLPTAAERAGDFRGLTRTANGWVPNAVATQFNLVQTGTSAIFQQFTLNNGRLVPIALATGNRYCQFGETPTSTTGGPQCLATNTSFNDALNVIPQAYIDPTSQRILSFLPMGGNYFLDNGVIANYVVNRQVTQNETRYTLRLDHNITKTNKINFRVTSTPSIGVRNFGSDINGSTGVFSNAKQFLIGDEHIFSPNIVNNLRFNYTRGVFSEDFSPEFSINGGRNLASELGLDSLTNGGIPLFNTSADGYNAFASIGSSGSTNNFNVEERFNINDIVYWTKGNMTWKFGVDLNKARLNVVPFFAASGGRWNFRTVNTSRNRGTNTADGGTPFASLLLGVPNSVDVRPLLLNYDYGWKSGAVFVQNDWKVKPNLTINLGLRYSLQLPRTEKNDLQGVFRPDLAQTVTLTAQQRVNTAVGLGVLPANSPATTPIPAPYNSLIPTTVQIPVFAFANRGGRSRYLSPVDYMGFEPRFGFAWSPKMKVLGFDTEKRSLVIRGGYGISHSPITGNNRLPNPDFGGFQTVSTTATGSTVGGTADSTQPVRLSGNNPFVRAPSLDQTLGIDSNGLITLNSLGVPGFAYAGDGAKSIPYVQSWNLSLQFEAFKKTVVEIAYVGSKGTHLYTPLRNINPTSIAFIEQLEANNINADTAFADPLGRKNSLGATITIPRSSVVTPYFGFSALNQFGDPSGNSSYNAGYIKIQRRLSTGLSFTSNYTFGKSIDDSSDASPDTRTLTGNVVSTNGQVYFGAPRSGDKAVSTFDITHNFSTTFVWDLPFGKGGYFLKNSNSVVQTLVGGWSMSGVYRLQGGTPFIGIITNNRLGGSNYTIRLNRVEGVPLKNPLWSSGCSIGAACEPYVNPAAFIRPPKGSLGNASRTLEDIRGPLQQFFDFSLQKSFNLPYIGNEGKRRINFRMDLLNAFNHPIFRLSPAGSGNTFGGVPTETNFTQNEVDQWNAANPGRNVTLTQVNNFLTTQRLPTGALPLNFFSVPVPEGFATRSPNSFDILTTEGLKLYRLRQAYNTGFGTLYSPPNGRYIQFGIRLFF
ncbi:MAG TPA: carboxypeptidase-like regulatory domain-containing protein [Pyrinomonadaceae bacterium]|nr:carboxypeptidase-like regulatory domain-containing protein [Pyrinomonadaceae bacterium]